VLAFINERQSSLISTLSTRTPLFKNDEEKEEFGLLPLKIFDGKFRNQSLNVISS